MYPHIHSPTGIFIQCVYSSPIVSIFSEVDGSIECQCVVNMCAYSTTSTCQVADKVAGSTEVKYIIVDSIDCTTMTNN